MTYQMRHPPSQAARQLDRAEIRALRKRIAEHVERLLALLDQPDGDPDLEPNGDDEPSLGSLVDVFGGPYGCTTLSQTEWGASGSSDREVDAGDDREAEDQDGDGEFSGGDVLGADEPAFEHPWGLAA